MTTKKIAKGRIEVKSWEQSAYDESAEGPTVNDIHVTETFTGDIEANGVARMLQAARKDESASFVAIERITGTLDGKQGTFLLQDEGALEGKIVKGNWFVVPGSATGGLKGLRGKGTFAADLGQNASYEIEYWFE